MQRAYSLFTVKSINEDQRIIEGIATTPTTDRMGDIVEPEGAQFKLPLPLLWQHDSGQPIGHVISAKVSAAGIAIVAKLANIQDAGKLKDRLDEAWQSIKSGLVRGFSIGFSPIESARIKDTWSEHYLKWDWLELSAVTIPANAEATIISIKSADQALLAASGERQRGVVRLKTVPGASGKPTIPKGNEMKTNQEKIAEFEAKRAASVGRMESIMAKADEEGRTLDAAESEEYDNLGVEVKGCDDHIVRLKQIETLSVAKAQNVTKTVAASGKPVASAMSPIVLTPSVDKGIAFARYVKALAMARGNEFHAMQIAEANKGWMDTTPQVALAFKAAVAGGDTTTSGWASELVYNQNLVGEFIDLLRPQTILGKIQGLTRVPFNVRMGAQNSGSTGYWVGQGVATPVSKLDVGEVTLGIAKAAGLVVLTDELVKSSQPSAELLVRNDLMKTISTFLDVHFIAPDYAAVTNVSPASITNGVTPTAATGTTAATLRADLQTMLKTFVLANYDPTGLVIVTTPALAMAIGLMLNALDQPLYPNLNMNGGELLGIPVVTSNSCHQVGSPVTGEGQMIVMLSAPDILLADEGGMSVEMSKEASIEMVDSSSQTAAGGTGASLVSMFQTNSIAIKAVRYMNWAKRRSGAVVYVKDAAYVA